MVDTTEEAKVEEEKKGDEDQEDTDHSEDEDDLDEVVSLIVPNYKQFDLNVTMDLINSPFKKIDEFEFFHKVLSNLH